MIGMFCAIKENDWYKKLDQVFHTPSMNMIKERLTLLSDLDSLDDLTARKDELATVDFLFSTWGAPVFTEDEIKTYFPSLKAYFYGAGSVQYFARPLLNSGVRVFCAATANSVPVSELCLAQILLANKGFFQSSRLYSRGERSAADEQFRAMPGNYDETVGLIASGLIARDVIRRLKDYRLSVVVYDPYLSDQRAKELGVKKVSLEELFETSITISNHLPNNDETKHMLTYDLFSRMRSHATFINTGRGAQVIEDDLVRALKEVPTRTAVLDVTFPEPVKQGHPFFTMDNVFLSPHLAGSAGNELRRMGQHMAEECLRLLDNQPLQYEVTLEMLAHMA